MSEVLLQQSLPETRQEAERVIADPASELTAHRALAERTIDLLDAIARVQEVHKPYGYDGSWEGASGGTACEGCFEEYEDGTNVPYPCPTIIAIFGPES